MAREAPESEAIVHPNGVVSYAELEAEVAVMASWLRTQGVLGNQRIALYLEATWRIVPLFFGLMRLGAVAVPLNTRRPVSAWDRELRDLEVSYLITGEAAEESSIPLISWPASGTGRSMEAGREPVIKLDQWATILFTSGSSGRPKAVVHSWQNHIYSALGAAENIPLGPGDRWLVSLPFYHVAGIGLMMRCLVGGAALVFKGQHEGLERVLRTHQVTHISLVPTQLRRLLDEPAGWEGALKAVLLGGSQIPEELVRIAIARGVPLHTTYGLTEMASQVTTTPPGASLPLLRTAGKLLPYRELKVDSDGIIWVRGRTLFAGYQQGTEILSPFDEEGWFKTGDKGRWDEAGMLQVTGRLDNMFISGGENIQPEEIEAVLLKQAGVRRAVVVPVPDNEFGFRPVAFVEGLDSGNWKASLVAAIAGELERFKIPDAIYRWPEATEEGMKIKRRVFIALALEIKDQ